MRMTNSGMQNNDLAFTPILRPIDGAAMARCTIPDGEKASGTVRNVLPREARR